MGTWCRIGVGGIDVGGGEAEKGIERVLYESSESFFSSRWKISLLDF